MSKGWSDKRPMSPHLSVWKWHPTMLSSILHRVTGIILFIGLLKICIFLVALAMGPSAFNTFENLIYSPLGVVSFFLFMGVLIYHFLNGIRHLVWDMGTGFDPKTANIVSIVIIALAFLLTLALTLYMVGRF